MVALGTIEPVRGDNNDFVLKSFVLLPYSHPNILLTDFPAVLIHIFITGICHGKQMTNPSQSVS